MVESFRAQNYRAIEILLTPHTRFEQLVSFFLSFFLPSFLSFFLPSFLSSNLNNLSL